MPKLSVIIPTYNRAEALRACLNSILESSETDIEVLVSNNASSDHTQEILLSFQDPRLRYWTNNENLGYSRNMVKLFAEAKGEWVLCISDDDLLLSGGIERTLNIVSTYTDVSVILSSLAQRDELGQRRPPNRFHKSSRKFSAGYDALKHLFWTTHIYSRITVRREFVDIEGTERHLSSLYPQMYLVGVILRDHPAYYLDHPIICHTLDNRTYWDYSEDYMVAGKINIIKDILASPTYRKEQDVLIRQVIDAIFQHHFPASWNKSEDAWVQHQKALLACPEVALSPLYWRKAYEFMAQKRSPALTNLKRVEDGLRQWCRTANAFVYTKLHR